MSDMINEEEKIGKISIADGVVASIAGIDAIEIFKAVDGFGLSRVDFFVDENGQPVFNEINTLPGFTAISMYPMLWEKQGISKKELVAKLGKKNLANGVKVEIADGNVSVDLSLEVEYGTSIKKVSEGVQEKVKQAIENMTGLHVRVVNVVVSGIKMTKE